MLQPDYKIFEMNKRLQQRTDDSDNLWWDAFANEFFEDEAQLTLTFCLEDGPKRYSKNFFYFLFRSQETETLFAAVGRTLIPRFFRSIFEGGVTDLHWELRHAKESFHQAVVSLDCDQATMVTQHGKPMFTKVSESTAYSRVRQSQSPPSRLLSFMRQYFPAALRSPQTHRCRLKQRFSEH